MSGPRVVVVGGGVIGVSCAYHLARGGAEVGVIEREEIGAGASSGNAGTIAAGHPPLNRPGRIKRGLSQTLDPTSPLYVHPHWNPGLWRWLMGFARYCTDEHVRHCMSVMGPLGRDALTAFDTLFAEEWIECGYARTGYFEACETEEGLATARHEADTIRASGYAPQELSGDELRAAEPAVGPGMVGAIFYPEAAILDPASFLVGLLAATRRRGAEVRIGSGVAHLRVGGGRASGVELTDGTSVDADVVVLATGAAVGQWRRDLGVRLPVQPGKGYHRDVDIGPNGAPRLNTGLVLAEHAVFCTPMDTAVRFAGTMEFSGHNRVMRRPRLRQLTNAARAAFPGMGTARPRSEWCGLRPMSVDGLPIVGPVPGVDGVCIATGHGMLGLTLGPVTGELVASHVLGREEPRLEPLLPSRFA